ncbi:hypothetical protein JCGZ_20628 [Jatropha curcas]|uniref:Uncharacterized protein n=1 Tax=Jatropha curcas TaxID=180498 RepID=A0A067JNL2_JATCU|nr:hypothetical protein JCGZ_20628 [Jatropha curcas]
MRIPSPNLTFLVLIIILSDSQLSSCRHLKLQREIDDQTKETPKPVLSPEISWHFPAQAPQGSVKDEIDPVYGVSFRKVPGGPNPLHN